MVSKLYLKNLLKRSIEKHYIVLEGKENYFKAMAGMI